MSVLPLPIRRQAFEAQAHRSGGQIGKLLGFDQNGKPTVLGQKMQPPFPLFLRPFDRLVAGFEVKGGRAPAEQSQPVTVGVGDHVAKLFPDKVGILEVMCRRTSWFQRGRCLGDTKETWTPSKRACSLRFGNRRGLGIHT